MTGLFVAGNYIPGRHANLQGYFTTRSETRTKKKPQQVQLWIKI